MRRMGALLAAAGLASALLAGCGGDDEEAEAEAAAEVEAAQEFATLSGDDVVSAASDTMTELESLRIRLKSDQPGVAQFDVRTTADGLCRATLTSPDGKGEFVAADQQLFLRSKADTFWASDSGDAAEATRLNQAADGRWVRIDRTRAGQTCQHSSWTGILQGVPSPETGELRDVAGRSAVAVTSTNEGGTTTYLIAATKPHHLLRINSSGTSITFSDFDEDFGITAPPNPVGIAELR